MKENIFLNTIQNIIHSDYIGDDTAYIKEKDLILTQDTLIENIHFKTEWISPYELGKKSIAVNLSDIAASGGVPKYALISLSLPKKYDESFVDEFYKGLSQLAKKFNVEIVGGDITGSEKIAITITLIGYGNGVKASKRSNANIGDLIITTGVHGSSAAGLWLLENNNKFYRKLVDIHKNPTPQLEIGREIAILSPEKLCMMDTSDGLADALYKISKMSNVGMKINLDKIPYDDEITEVAKLANKDYRDWILYGGEDYQLIAAICPKTYEKLTNLPIFVIGEVTAGKNIIIENHNEKPIVISENSITNGSFDHFEGEIQ